MMLHEKKFSTGAKANKLDQHNEEVAKAQEQIAGASSDDVKLVDLFIRKNRSGRMGVVHLLFKKNFCRFDALSQEAERRYEELENESINYLPSE